MATDAGHGFGTSLKKGADEVAELDKIGGIETVGEFADASSHQSADAFREKVMGMLSASAVPIEGSFIPGDATGQVTLLTDHYARTKQTYVITLPAAFGTTLTFDAFVGKVKIGDEPIDGKIPFSAELELTGKPVVAITASVNITALTCTDDVGAGVFQPAFAAATYEYVVEVANGATEYSLNATFAAGVCTLTDATGGEHTLLTTVESSELTSPGAGNFHDITLSVKETGKMATVYTLHIMQS